jgi:tellurite resistance protein
MSRDIHDEQIEFLKAAGAIYAWMSFSDGEVVKAEVNSFIKYLTESPFVNSVSEEDFKEIYLTMVDAFSNSFEDGRARAQSRIEVFKGREGEAKSLVTLAQKALIADGRDEDSEEATLKEICEILGQSYS